MLKVEIFSSPGCSKCGQATAALKAAAMEFGADKVIWREVDVLKEMDYAVDLGVLSTPAIAIDGELVFANLPSVEKMRTALRRRLSR